MSVHRDASGAARIVEVATGYMAAKQLFAATETGLFAALAKGPASAAELAARTGLPERTARILADAMTALGLLTRTGGRYDNTPAAARHLTGGGEDLDLRPFLTFLDTISYPHWLGFGASARTARPAPLDLGGDRMEIFLTGVMTYNALHARTLAAHYDFTAHRHALDLGGLSGAFLAEALRSAPALRGAFCGDGELAELAMKALEEAGVAERAELIETDPLTGDLPTGFDLVLLEHVVHRFGPEENLRLAERARAVAAPGATLLVLDFFLDADPVQRLVDALHAAEYLVIDGTRVHPEDEVRGWLDAAGWEPRQTLCLPGCPRVLVARAR
ncbi:methyltransferase family protein [Nonomuraea typhae]|uniref:methyltransferase family protein n=1 Tax=Nonomuraea typhae TaxID=2603600 RepID=UPI0012F9C0FC|nr:methyltransferase dimerization domain-containing protein [Nonomuraea typhae]